jgi:EmrB/QacA subfamily drug resistance transporter
MAHLGPGPCDQALTAQPAGVVCSARAQRWVLVAAIGGSSMAFVDGTVVNVALPAIQASLQATAAEAQWVVESYALLLAALLLVGGALGDRYGRRRVFMLGVAVFTGASLGCALAGSVGALIAARAVQGAGAALLVPGSLALISATFPPDERGRAIGTWSGFSGITAAFGPLAGGYLVDHGSWHWAFLINLPLGLAVLAIARWQVPESRGAAAGPIDVSGAVLATAGLGGIVYAFIEAPRQGWGAAPVLIALLAGGLAGAAFVAVEARRAAPMLPLGLFRLRPFAAANLLTLLLYAALGGSLFFFPMLLIDVHGYSATAAGAALLPFVLIVFLLSRWSGRLVDRVGAKLPLVAGPLTAALGFALFAWPGVGAAYATSFLPAVVVLGLGMAVTIAPLTTTVMNAVEPDRAGLASGVNNAVSRAAAVLAIAVLGVLMAWVFDAELAARAASLDLSGPALETLRAQRGRADAGAAPAVAEAVRHAYTSGFRAVMLAAALLAVASAVAAFAMLDGPEARQPM